MSDNKSKFDLKLEQVKEKLQTLEDKLSQGIDDNKEFAKTSKEYSDLKPVVEAIDEYFTTKSNMEQAQELLKDPEMKELAEMEYHEAKHQLPEMEDKIKIMLLPKDEADEKNAILEIRAGTGGDEAALFAGNLLEMYRGLATNKGWRFEITNVNEAEVGGVKEAIVEISGQNVFSQLKYESGVHRVQRVPETETQGRVHTSAATVAVMPEAEDIDIQIDPKDLRIDTFRASGAGGQHVNKTESAVRITHIPTNTVAECQDGRSQLANKDKAMKTLKARIYDAERQRQEQARAADRKSKVGTGDRSARIRTYNYPQGRISEHRINLTLYKLDDALAGGPALQEIIDALTAEENLEKLANLEA
jgi:peptide chain release factor 1